MLTVSEASEDMAPLLNGGAKGYALKGVGSRALAEILRSCCLRRNIPVYVAFGPASLRPRSQAAEEPRRSAI